MTFTHLSTRLTSLDGQMMRNVLPRVLLALLSPPLLQVPVLAQGLGGGGGRPHTDCVSEADRLFAERSIRRYEAWTDASGFNSQSSSPGIFTFYPLAGTLYGDLFPYNFVDVQAGNGLLDWDCTDFTYDGHDASDVDIRTFGEQVIGVPVFAALDGVVVETHDGEPDMNTSCQPPANQVIIDHGNGRICRYLHLKQNSILVQMGDLVFAGQQLGLAGSSGCSYYPHLHFATYDDNSVVEPYAGPCRAGESLWTDQQDIVRDLYVWDFSITDADLSGWSPPYDTPRIGSFVTGLRKVWFWAFLNGLQAGSTWRVRFIRPDGSVPIDSGTTSFGNPFYRSSYWWWWWNVDLNQTGTWTILLDVNGQQLVSAPFDVYSSANQIHNRAPYGIGTSFEPAYPFPEDVIVCRLSTDLVHDDQDYDIVRYRYHWRIDGNTVRDVTTAAHSDSLRRLLAGPGQVVECTVTPSDGMANGPSSTISVVVGTPPYIADQWTSPPSIVLGDTTQTVTLYYRIHNPNSQPVPVGLGASISVAGQNDWKSDPGNDKYVTASAGYTLFDRQFDVDPELVTTALEHDVAYALWDHIGQGQQYHSVVSPDLTIFRELPAGKWTIISHGFLLPGHTYAGNLVADGKWMRLLGERIAGISSTPVVVHKMWDSSTMAIDPPIVDPGSHHVLLFNWADTSNSNTFPLSKDGFAYAAGDALYGMVRHLGAEGDLAALIGHSRGSVVISECTRRLALADYSPNQVIFLDGEGEGWNLVAYEDELWNAWETPNECTFDNIFQENIFCSMFLGGEERPACNGFNVGKDYIHAELPVWCHRGIYDYLIEGMSYTEGQYVYPVVNQSNGDYQQRWDPWVPPHPESIYNGLLGQYAQWGGSQAGWRGHGGWGKINNIWPSDPHVELDQWSPSAAHNWSWIEDSQSALVFQFKVVNADAVNCNDTAHVYLEAHGDASPTDIKQFGDLCSTDDNWIHESVLLPSYFRGRLCRLTLKIQGNGDGVDSRVDIQGLETLDCVPPSPPTTAWVDKPAFCQGEYPTITLSASGGSGDQLKWYSAACGDQYVGTGNPVTIPAPSVTTSYYVRWETAGCGSSQCAEVVVTVYQLPGSPGNVTASPGVLCDGGSTTLSASVPGATITWYTDGCYGTVIGTGNSIVVTPPVGTTTYYASATDTSTGCSSTDCGSVAVTVNTLPPDPGNVTASPGVLCAGESTTLSASFQGATIWWYSDGCFETSIGTGNSIVVTPSTTTTYYASATDDSTGCSSTGCGLVTVTVNAAPPDPDNVAADPAVISPGDNSTLSASVPDCDIYWYSGSCFGTLVEVGNQIVVWPSATTEYFAAAVSQATGCWSVGCGTTTVLVTTVAPAEDFHFRSMPKADSILLGWSPSPDEELGLISGYRIRRYQFAEDELYEYFDERIATETTLLIEGLDPGQEEYARIEAFYETLHSSPSPMIRYITTANSAQGDVNGNGVTDGHDLVDALFAFGVGQHTGHNAAADIDESGVVDQSDIDTIVNNLGWEATAQ